MKHIAILGWFGSGNIGDDAILDSEIQIIREIYPKAHITIFCGEKNSFEEIYENVSTQPLPPIAIYRGYKFLNIFYTKKILDTLKNVDLLILGGGGFFSDRQHFAVKGWLKYCKVAKKYGAKVVGIGLGAGPFYSNTNKQYISKSSEYIDNFIVRDQKSYQYMQECGFDGEKLIQSIDLAFFNSNKALQKKNRISFVVHSNEQFYIQQIQEIHQKTDYNVYLLVSDDNDIKLNTAIACHFTDRVELKVMKKADEFISEISKSNFVVAERLHGSIIAFTQKTPFLNIYYHHKGKELIDLLDIEFFSIDIKKIN